MSISKKSIIDNIDILLTKFSKSDDSRLDDDFLSAKIDEIRAQLIIAQFKITNVIDQTWQQDLGEVTFHDVNFADNNEIDYCNCDISKAFIPQIISLELGNGNQDLGLSVFGVCGKKKFYPYALTSWMEVPPEHTRSLFNYYARINTALYKNKKGNARIVAVLQNPEDAYVINSAPVVSGNIQTGVVYLVKYNQIIYNGVVYLKNTTFTGVVGVTTYTGTGLVYLNTQAEAFTDLDNYPVTGDMARQIVIEICTKEFNIERSQIIDVKNDSTDDAAKV